MLEKTLRDYILMEVERLKRLENLNFKADLLKEAIRSRGLSQHKVAKELNITDKTFSNKMNGTAQWKLSEIQQLQKILYNLDVCEVFNLNVEVKHKRGLRKNEKKYI